MMLAANLAGQRGVLVSPYRDDNRAPTNYEHNRLLVVHTLKSGTYLAFHRACDNGGRSRRF